ncbi:MAG: hypothetical protein ABI549_04785 [Flavobacterium sp.]|uniref:hypothetical protein n=1 Tax=Flavobacterium sp. TaxID=239 RepID=UPI0032637A16
MDRLKYILILTLLFNKQVTFAQNKNSISELKTIDEKINESIFINTNTNVFLTGENLLYKLFCLNNNTNSVSVFSKIAYVELVDSNKKKVFTQKLFLEKGIGYGDFFIPTTLETGNYKLIGYTNWMLNKSSLDYFNIDIFIVNPYQISNNNLDNNIPEKNISKIEKLTEETTNNISIGTNKTTYSNREIVNLEIQSNIIKESLKGSYSISVRKIDSFSLKKKLNSVNFSKSKINSNIDSNFNSEKLIIPEFRGEIISGKIKSKLNTNTVEDKNISLSIPGENYAFKITKTNKNGEFIFNLENSFPSSNVVIQIIDSDKENYKIEINNTKSPDYSSLSFNELKLSTELKKIIEEKSIASQIENAYHNNKKDNLINTKSTRKFYDFTSKEYILDDYTRFPTLKETIIEIIDGMYYKTTNNNYTLHLYDYDVNSELQIPALVIVDGLIIQDINELFQHKADNIYKINIVKGGYYFGTKLYNGVVALTTKNYDYESKINGDFIIKPNILRPLQKKEYYKTDYRNNINSRIPDYRYQLLWQPDVKLENKEQTISFFTSDVIGEFEIILEGFSDKGIAVYVSTIIEVK